MTIEKANRFIRDAWIAGIFSVGINVMISFRGIGFFRQDIRNLVDVFIVGGLTFGIYKKSRICAITMFIYFVINKILILDYIIKAPSLAILWILLFGYVFFQGVRGTFTYHKLNKIGK